MLRKRELEDELHTQHMFVSLLSDFGARGFSCSPLLARVLLSCS